jgi:ABC-type nitrate/sulfonate/bicarbonate transport system substrate-binding protein
MKGRVVPGLNAGFSGRIIPMRPVFARRTLLLTALLAYNAIAAEAQNAPLEFNYGYPTVDHVNIYVAQDLGLFERVGLKPKFFTFQSGAPLLAALKSESLDVVTAGLGLAFALGQNIPLKILYWTSNDAAGEGLVVDPKSGIKSYMDITKAHKIGAASGTCAQVALFLLTKKVAVDYSKLDVVNIPAPLFRNSFLSHSIEAGIAWAPYSMSLQSEGYPVVNWDPDYTPLGGLCPRMTGARPDFLKSHPQIGARLLQADALASQAVAKDPQLAIDAIAKRLALTAPVAKATFERVYLQRPTVAQQLDPASPYSLTAKEGGLAANLLLATQTLYETKSISQPIPMNTIQDAIDPSYLKEYLGAGTKN